MDDLRRWILLFLHLRVDVSEVCRSSIGVDDLRRRSTPIRASRTSSRPRADGSKLGELIWRSCDVTDEQVPIPWQLCRGAEFEFDFVNLVVLFPLSKLVSYR